MLMRYENKNLAKQNELVIKIFKEFMKDKGYELWLSESPDCDCDIIASKEYDKFIPTIEISKWKDFPDYNVYLKDRNGESYLRGEFIANYSLYIEEDTSDEEIEARLLTLLNDLYNKYGQYSKENRIDFIYNNLKIDNRDY